MLGDLLGRKVKMAQGCPEASLGLDKRLKRLVCLRRLEQTDMIWQSTKDGRDDFPGQIDKGQLMLVRVENGHWSETVGEQFEQVTDGVHLQAGNLRRAIEMVRVETGTEAFNEIACSRDMTVRFYACITMKILLGKFFTEKSGM
jgi:hypothetical protein